MEANVEVDHSAPSIPQLLLELVVLIVRCLYRIAVSIFYIIKEKPLSSVKGEIVLVTGAGHGIGRALARKYASEGATVVCWDINKENNDETVKEIGQLGYPKAYAYICDVRNSKDVEEVAKKVEKDVGSVTILINNAGIAATKPLVKVQSDEIENIMRVNTLSHFWTIKAFLPGMQRNNRGHIVAICSIAGLYGSRNGVPYCTTKFALRGLMEALYQELRTDVNNKVNLTTIYPAGVNTGIFTKARLRFPKLLPIITPNEAANCVVRAQRRNDFESSIPSYSLPAHNLMRLLPVKVQDIILDFIDTYVVE